MAKTGSELKTLLVGEASGLEDATVYTPNVKLRVTLQYPYNIGDQGPGDNGDRVMGKVIYLDISDFASLTSVQRNAIIALAESKL